MTSPQLSKQENFQILKNIGKGSFGVVSKILVTENNQIYALKQMYLPGKNGSDISKEALEEARKEYNLLKRGIHHVVRSLGSLYEEKPNVFSFSMEYFPYNLNEYVETTYIEKKMNMPFQDFSQIFSDVITGFLYLIYKYLFNFFIFKQNK